MLLFFCLYSPFFCPNNWYFFVRAAPNSGGFIFNNFPNGDTQENGNKSFIKIMSSPQNNKLN